MTTRRVGVTLGLLALATTGGAGGYAVGTTSGADVDRARDEGRDLGKLEGTRLGSSKGAAVGRKLGRRTGYRQTFRKAYLAAHRRTVKSKTPSSAPSDPGQPVSCSAGLVSAANGCVPEQQAVCAAYQDFVPGRGCVPPLKQGEVEAKPQCPRGWIPVGVTGACAPE